DYKGRTSSTIGAEKKENPRLQQRERTAFVELMRGLDIAMPEHLTEALRTNRTGGKTALQLIAEGAREVPFMSMEEVRARLESDAQDLVVLDVREREAFEAGHVPGARHVPRGQLELRVDQELPDPTARVLAYCQYGKISTLAAATLRTLGYMRAIAMDGGMDAWVRADYPVEGARPSDRRRRGVRALHSRRQRGRPKSPFPRSHVGTQAGNERSTRDGRRGLRRECLCNISSDVPQYCATHFDLRCPVKRFPRQRARKSPKYLRVRAG